MRCIMDKLVVHEIHCNMRIDAGLIVLSFEMEMNTMNRRSAIQRLIGHIQFHLSGIMTAFRDSKDEIIDFQIDADLSNKMKELVQQLQDIEYSRAEPIFEPRRTMLICGTGKFAECNFLNAFLMRKYIKGTHYRMAKCGFNTYIVDYSTPFGYLALQVLNDLRECGERNHLYIFKSTVNSRQRKSYHLIPETDFERIV